MTVGQRIQQIRVSLGLSQEEFGEKLEVTRQTISKWELDQTLPEVQKIVMMSKLFSVTTDSILVDGISTFDINVWGDGFVCGVYRGADCEILETERFVLVYGADTQRFEVGCVTDRTEYIFSIAPKQTNIYCGAAYNIPFELGMFGGGQYFRFRNFGENKEKWCGFFCNFNMQPPQVEIPVNECRTGECVKSSKGYIWAVKRYTDDMIVLQGCGEDEYTYRRDVQKEEAFIF